MGVIFCLLDGLSAVELAGEGFLYTGFLELAGIFETLCFAFGLLCFVLQLLSAGETVTEKL